MELAGGLLKSPNHFFWCYNGQCSPHLICDALGKEPNWFLPYVREHELLQ